MLSSVELHSLPSLALLWVLLDTVAFIFQDFPDLVICCDGKLETFQIKCTPVIPALRKWRQEDWGFKATLKYIMSLKPALPYEKACLRSETNVQHWGGRRIPVSSQPAYPIQ